MAKNLEQIALSFLSTEKLLAFEIWELKKKPATNVDIF